jgi:hypothetical protein
MELKRYESEERSPKGTGDWKREAGSGDRKEIVHETWDET